MKKSEKQASLIRRILPRSLFGRALLILVLPVLLVQLVVAYVFFARHWDQIERQLSSSLTQEVGFIYNIYNVSPDADGLKEAKFVARQMGMKLHLDTQQTDIMSREYNVQSHDVFTLRLRHHIPDPFTIVDGDKHMELRILVDAGVLVFTISRKRLVSVTTDVFILTMVAASVVFLLIAVVFLRNQIRPITRLAKVAERFGMGQNTKHFQPRGAREVRLAGQAFITMRDRIERYVASRTDMLAGISHDLRTPLTRMKLQLAVAANKPETLQQMHQDVEQMEHMINEYLEFARGSGGEASVLVSLDGLLTGLIDKYKEQSHAVSLAKGVPITLTAKPNALMRALQNVIDNALRYGKTASVKVSESDEYISIAVDDEGPGIAEEQQEHVFQPFKRLDEARNLSEAGVGLGLSIARDSIMMQGGKIVIQNRYNKKEILGLSVEIILPKKIDDYKQ